MNTSCLNGSETNGVHHINGSQKNGVHINGSETNGVQQAYCRKCACDKDDVFGRQIREIEEACDYLLSRTDYRPKIAIICGTGLGGLTDDLADRHKFPYADIPHCVPSSVKGHEGCLVFGKLSGLSVVCMKGRIHSFEGHSMWKLSFLVRVFAAMGVRVLMATNASGSMNPDYQPGDVMIMKDHINLPGLVGLNPLIGLNDDRFGTRFPMLTDAYDRELRQLARDAVARLQFDKFFHEGVYCYQTGPCFETVTENRLMQLLGADVVGMSTVPEVLVAVHCHMRILAFSVITNRCILEYDSDERILHDEVLEVGNSRTKDLRRLIAEIIPDVATVTGVHE